ncbi:hypothetical protein QF032_007875 [Streptomyces achromogenes]|uniref:Uncharacterized protein n=1 Tax=Streptomyces achromogenes TaxID=67255 RepID=A0ABU0QDY4_STRAH|nr:hypothetical protein [Streptomyces achromogenes]MDQ0688865.1 hypothetical protein [Streptomyces achromogenes]MDQ0836031.1 hypothetical protein [Streptomyces achromogenes]
MRTSSVRAGLTALLVATGVLAGASGAQAQAQPAFAKTYLNTVVTQWTHWTPDAENSSHAGTLYAGRNYFYCWTVGQLYYANGRSSQIWLKTDDDTGHRNVWVNDVNLDEWGYYHDQSALPHC